LTDLEHISNVELVSQFNWFLKSNINDLEAEYIKNLKTEILRRLNEPWRKIKDE
jgi:hypothetical protein